ncbi:hypothetical protein ACR79P_14660 [Sphingobacterium spiritivorum]|uniref:hypothetical protein n=1 Tax=Sphingobacterium spiritivorum TaxID=258 RepID=UPI003DA32126
MKSKLLIMLLSLSWVGGAWGQEMGVFKEKNNVKLSGFPGRSFKYSPKDSLIIEKITNVIYDKDGNMISYSKTKEKKESDAKNLDENVLKSLKLGDHWSKANLSVKDDKVFIYPFTYKSNVLANKFFQTNNVYLELEERQNYSFKYRTWQIGVVTIPLKWYVKSKLGNVTTDVNAMINIGHKFGKTHVVNLPHEEKARQYQRTWSVNFLAGISKLILDESNTLGNDPIKGNVAAISTGFSFGMHYQDFTFLAASGFDFPTSNGDNWKFSKIPWIGLGVGYNFIKLAGKSN